MKLRLRDFLAPLVIVSVCCQNTEAADVTFDFTSGVLSTYSFSKTVSGYTLVFSNPSPYNIFEGDTDGLVIGANNNPIVNQFQIVLTGGPVTDALLFKNYEVGYVGIGGVSPAAPFSLTGGSGTSTNNSLASTGVFSFAGPFSIAQGQTVTFSSPGTNANLMLSQIKFMTFTVVPVPEPSTYALGTIAAVTLAWLARKRRNAAA